MDPQASQDLTSWLFADWRRAVLWAVVFLVLPVLHRRLSLWVGQRDRPAVETLWSRFIGWVSGAVWHDAPGSVKPIFGRMPAGRITPDGGFRSGDTNPRISGQFPRLPPVTTLAIGCLFAFASGCASTVIDKARLEYSRTLKAATAVNAKFRTQSRAYQEKNIRRIGPHTPAAEQWQKEFIVKRVPVEDQIRRCDEILSEASDLLLLSDDVRGVAAARNATACVSTLKDMIAKLFDGGL